MAGDNSDVRPPASDEFWKGGWWGCGFGGGSGRHASVAKARLTLDGIFFSDGEFVGRDEQKMWDRIVSQADAYMHAARVAVRAHQQGLPRDQILAAVEDVTGPLEEPPPPPPHGPRATPGEYLKDAMQIIATRVVWMRRSDRDEAAVKMLLSWADAELPRFRKR